MRLWVWFLTLEKEERQEQRVPESDCEEAERPLLEYLRHQQIFLRSCSIWSQSVARLGFDNSISSLTFFSETEEAREGKYSVTDWKSLSAQVILLRSQCYFYLLRCVSHFSSLWQNTSQHNLKMNGCVRLVQRFQSMCTWLQYFLTYSLYVRTWWH